MSIFPAGSFPLPDLGEQISTILAVDRLRSLKALGVGLSVDDFGTGYSSMPYRKRFPVDVLKIDRMFIDGLGRDPEDSAIVLAIITLAHTLDLSVVAEGVETEQQLQLLLALDCDRAHGYYFARPVAADMISRMLESEINSPHETPTKLVPIGTRA